MDRRGPERRHASIGTSTPTPKRVCNTIRYKRDRAAITETLRFSLPHPVDTSPAPAHRAAVSKKPSKVSEPQAPYAAKKPAKGESAPKTEAGGVRYIDDATFQKASAKVFKTHAELFRKLAQ